MTKIKDQAPDLEGVAPESLSLSDGDVAKARAEGAKEAVKEAAKDAYTALTDGNLPGDVGASRFGGSEQCQLYAHLLDLGVKEFEDAIAVKKDGGVPENMVYGILGMERNGQNRTPYVKAGMKRLGIKADELPGGGPSYTNDLTNITDL